MEQLTANFHNADVRIADTEPLLIVVSDVAKALGYRDAHTIKRTIKDKYLCTHDVRTAKGVREMICATRPGISQALATLKPQSTEKRKAVEAFQDWIYEDVLESIYETGRYEADADDTGPTPAYDEDPIIQIRKRQIDLERRVDRLEEREAENEDRRLDAQRKLRSLPEAETDVPEKSARARLNEIVRAYAAATGTQHSSAWRMLYREISYRLGVNITARSRNRGIRKIQVLDDDGLLDDAYSVARKIFYHALGDRL